MNPPVAAPLLRSSTSAEAALPAPRASAGTKVDAAAIGITVYTSLAEVEPLWRAFEERAIRSIYQRFDWVSAWVGNVAAAEGITTTVVVGWRCGETQFILPFGRLRRRSGMSVGWLGGSHVNVGMGLYDPDFMAGITAPEMLRIMRNVAAALAPVDFFALCNQPESWQGYPNPMGHLPGRQADQPVFCLPLESDFAAVVERHNGARKRKKLRWQENTLAKVGGYRFVRTTTEAEALRLLDAFLEQKTEQFARSGVDNVFAKPGVADAFRALIATASRGEDSLIELYGIEIGGRYRATFAAGVDRGRMHGYFAGISLDEYQRVSPGELLLMRLIRQCCERSLSEFDLGVGEERYKTAWNMRAEPQFMSLIPVSYRGHAAVAGHRLISALRIAIRTNPQLWRMAKRLRQKLAGRAPAPDPAGAAR